LTLKVLITGANGFLGKNLQLHLSEKEIEIVSFTSEMSVEQFPELLNGVDFVFHLAGINRSKDPDEFTAGNKELTEQLCDAIRSTDRQIAVIYTSSIQADNESLYGATKKAAEKALISLERDTGSPVYIYRLPNVFGKWCRPNYNSVVATFCYNIANNLQIQINDPDVIISLVYIDDVIADFIKVFLERSDGLNWPQVTVQYSISVGDLAKEIFSFKASRETMVIEAVGAGLTRALYSTYLSYLKQGQISYSLPVHEDHRGRFVEMLKTKDSGQISFFTVHPGITRGGHFHHSKNEKFLVIKGKARFGFRHVISGETYSIITDSMKPEIVETVPGWSHDITNVSNDEMIVMLWANEIFDRFHPDTISHKVLA
jgi:UDP-2-acetamido-2,6-beta-L-arabino-hexul-4-ose reductase